MFTLITKVPVFFLNSILVVGINFVILRFKNIDKWYESTETIQEENAVFTHKVLSFS